MKLVPIVGLIVAGPFFIDPTRLAVHALPPAGAVARTSILLVFAFAGIEMALTPSGEVHDVARTVPRAIFAAMLTVTLIYVALQVVGQGVLGADLAKSGTPLADTAERMFGLGGRRTMLVAAAVSMFGTLTGHILAVPRALFAFGRDGFLPRPLAAVHPRFRTPHVAIAAWQLRRKDVRAGGVPFRVPGKGVAPWAACAFLGWMLTSVTAAEWSALGLTLAVAAAVYLATSPARAAASGASGRSVA